MDDATSKMGPLARRAARLGPADALVVCFERVGEAPARDELVRCVALPGPLPGLSLGPTGQLCWHSRAADNCLVMVSADRQLVLWRPAGSTSVRLCREGRSLDLPDERVVVVLDQDEVVVGAVRLRVHVHGPARQIHPPFRVRLAGAARGAALLASVGVGGALAACDAGDASGPASSAVASSESAVVTADATDLDASTDGGSPTGPDAGQAPTTLDAGPTTSASASASAPAPSSSAPRPPPTKRPIEVRKRPPVYWDG